MKKSLSIARKIWLTLLSLGFLILLIAMISIISLGRIIQNYDLIFNNLKAKELLSLSIQESMQKIRLYDSFFRTGAQYGVSSADILRIFRYE